MRHSTPRPVSARRRLATAVAATTLTATLAAVVPAPAPATAAGPQDPGQQITRGETAQLLYRFSGQHHDPGAQTDFTDVPTSRTEFAAVSWLQEEGYTHGYANGTFGVDRPISYRELDAFLTRVTGATGVVSGSGRTVTRGEVERALSAQEAPDTRGVYEDAEALTFSNGATTSQYHLYADHLDGSTPHGVIIHLHGDGGFEYNDPEWSTVPAYRELARQHNLMLVVPRTPDQATMTWWQQDSSGDYAADLLRHLGSTYALDQDQVYWTGYSGGADTVARQMMNSHSAGWTGGAAVIVAGGGVYGQQAPLRPISDALREDYSMHWVVGADDTPAAGGASGVFDAVGAARLGHDFYAGLGMETSLTVKPGMDHWEIASSGPQKLAEVLAAPSS